MAGRTPAVPALRGIRIGIWLDHLKAVRIPLAIVVLGLLLTFYVDQVAELFFLLVTGAPAFHKVSALLSAFILGLAVWHASRTTYRFDLPNMTTLADPRGIGLRKWTPRLLGMLVPLLMMFGCISALGRPSLQGSETEVSYVMPVAFGISTVILALIVVTRRPVMRRLQPQFPATPQDEPRARGWTGLGRSILIVYGMLLGANLLVLLAAAWLPGMVAKIGPIGVILLSAAFTTTTLTVLTIEAYRWNIPLLTLLFAAAVCFQVMGWNDNHRVRLYPGMSSDDEPDPTRIVRGPAIAGSFEEYAASWMNARNSPAAGGSKPPVYLVSAEGGGIRAAAWTVLVLAQLEVDSKGEFSRQFLAGSGVSGGSLGLALFTAMVKARDQGTIETEDFPRIARDFLGTDYLAPTLEAMFYLDFTQRFLPWTWFSDRGQRLETMWERGWWDAAGCGVAPDGKVTRYEVNADTPHDCAIFSRPWKDLWSGSTSVPVLFLNATVVQTGERFVQHPFGSLRHGAPDADVLNAAVGSGEWIPASAPLSGLVHNSARFTYVSPAGTLARVDGDERSYVQVVDGGYFENSGAATLGELAVMLSRLQPACSAAQGGGLDAPACPIRVIHISNALDVRPLLGDDRCPARARETGDPRVGETAAPIIALVNTRDARGALSRESIRKLIGGGSPASLEASRLFHFRLCAGRHHLPLGWALSEHSLGEMTQQLTGKVDSPASSFNARQVRAISASVLPAGVPSQTDADTAQLHAVSSWGASTGLDSGDPR